MDMKPWYQSKTLWVGVLSALTGIATLAIEFINKSDFSPVAIVAFVYGVVMIILRIFTTQAIG